MFVNEDEASVLDCCGPERCGDTARKCRGAWCMAWRWEPLMVNPKWIAAVKTAALEIDDKTPGRHKAAALVNANLAAYGLPPKPFRGWCGLAGHPDQFT